MDEKGNEHVSLVRIPRKWYYVFVFVFPALIVTQVVFEIFFDWDWKKLLGETALERMAVLMTLIVGWFFIVSHISEVIMLGLAKLYKEKIYANAENKVYEKLEREGKKGKTLEEVLEAHNAEKNGKGNQHSGSKAA